MDNKKDIKVAAVVVTYNRLELLKECVEALRAQTYKNVDFIIVNNGSTDGTREWLASQKDLIVINQENVGGAGGFYAGMKYMFEHDYDALWMMDDDGLADGHQLEELLKAAEKYQKKVLNALVVSKADPTRLAFGTQEKLTDLDMTIDITEENFRPFNGTFIHRSVIEKVGFIKKEMFIWGDEREYRQRMIKAGYTPYTVNKAIHYHPDEKGQQGYVFPFIKKGGLRIKPPHLSHYYYRNMGYLCKNYYGVIYTIKFFTYYTIYYTVHNNIPELKKFYKYFRRGMKNDYSD